MGWKPRKHSWVEAATLLFIDNPVGTGFSYVDKHATLTTSNAGIVADLMSFLRKFLHEKPQVPLLDLCRSLTWPAQLAHRSRTCLLNLEGLRMCHADSGEPEACLAFCISVVQGGAAAHHFRVLRRQDGRWLCPGHQQGRRHARHPAGLSASTPITCQ